MAILLGMGVALWGQPRGRMVTLRAREARGTIAAPVEFRALGAFGAAMDRRVRASADGLHWTEWVRSEPDSETSSLIWFETPQRYFQVEGGAGDLSFLAIDPGAAPAPAIAAPQFVTRAQWGCTPEACPVKAAPSYTTVTHLIVHHTAGANTASDWAAVVRSIWVLHVQGNGWNDIGYNYLIDPNGVMYEGRAGGDGVLGAHFSGVNSGTMGVSMMGTYSTIPVTAEARNTLRDMLAWQADKWKIDPRGERLHASSGLVLRTISGHRDANLSPSATSTTECPGNGLYPALPALRAEVGKLVAGACPVTLTAEAVCAGPDGGTVTVGVTAACPLTAAGPASWVQPVLDGSTLTLKVPPNDGGQRSAWFSIGGRLLTLTQAAPGQWPAPCVAARGVVSAAADEGRPAVAGSLVSIYGANLAAAAAAATTPVLPQALGGVTVTIDGRAAPLFFVSPGQINLQLPPQTNIGSARAIVTKNGIAGPEAMFSVTEATPAVFERAPGRALAQNYPGGELNGPEAPVAPGGVVTVYVTGAGAVAGGYPAAGTPAPASTLAPVELPWSATIGGQAAKALFLGLAPGMVGVYQANIGVPTGLPPGDYPLVVTVGGVTSTAAAVTVGGRQSGVAPSV